MQKAQLGTVSPNCAIVGCIWVVSTIMHVYVIISCVTYAGVNVFFQRLGVDVYVRSVVFQLRHKFLNKKFIKNMNIFINASP